MRSPVTHALRGAATLLVVLFAACASSQSVKSATETATDVAVGATAITVRNNHSAARDMVIYLEPEGRGERRNIGTVGSGESQTFTVAPERGYYVLIAAHNLGEVQSPRFNITAPSTISWTMGTNRVVVNRR